MAGAGARRGWAGGGWLYERVVNVLLRRQRCVGCILCRRGSSRTRVWTPMRMESWMALRLGAWRGGVSERDVAGRGRTDWCVMSMLSGPLRMTRFPPTPAILLSRDWAQVSVTCGRASGAACDRTCSCSKLGDAIVGCEEQRNEEQRKKDEWSGDVANYFSQSHLISSFHLLHSFFHPQWTPSSSQRFRLTPHPSLATHPPLSPPPHPPPSSALPTPQTGNSTCPKRPAPAHRHLPQKSLSSTRTQTFSG